MRGQVGTAMITYRVVSTEEPVVHYQGQSFKHASLIFDLSYGNRLMERLVNGEWLSVMSYDTGG